jgi:class 3 adenylate cyclase
MMVLTSDMRAVRAARVEGGVMTDALSLTGDVNLTSVMVVVRDQEGPSWGEIIWSPELGASLINLRAPIHRDGVFLGAVFSAIRVTDFSTFLTEFDDARTANLFILYGEDRVLAHPALIGGAFELSEDKPLPRLAEVGDPILNRTWLGAPPPPLPALEGEVEGYRVEFGDDAYAVLYRDLDSYGAVPWRIGATVAIEDLTAGVRRLLTAAAAGGAVLVIAVLLALLLGRNMARPVHRLADAARGVEDLDFDDVPVIAGGGFRETREAAAAFNAMLGGLRAFSIYVPRSLVRRLVAQGDGAGLHSEAREVTVLFTDIVGFTTQAEGLSPDQIAAFLNEHFTLLTREVEAAHGTVDKYIGDSVMAFWGAPEHQPDHARLAAACALAMAAAITTDNDRRRAAGEAPVRIRIGIHSGPAIVGNIGGPTRVDYTLVGDTVNTASRLVDLARNYMAADDTASVLIGGPTAAALGDDFTVEALGEEDIRGRQGRLALYRLVGT